MESKIKLSPNTIEEINRILLSGNEAVVSIEKGVIKVCEISVTEEYTQQI